MSNITEKPTTTLPFVKEHLSSASKSSSETMLEDSFMPPPENTDEVQQSPDVDANANADAEKPLTGVELYLLLAGLTLSIFLMTLNASILATAIPKITAEFDTVVDIGWYSSAYLLANCSLGPLTGKIYTFCRLKWTFIIFLGLFELGSLISALAPNSKVFIVARAVAGMGGSGIFNGAITILAAGVPFEKRPTLIGIATSFAGISQLAGPIVGGAITEKLSWRWCFWVDLPAGALAAVLLAFIRIPDGARKQYAHLTVKQILARLDLIGFALFAPAIIMVLLATQWGGLVYPWHSATIIGLFCGSFGMLCIWLVWQHYKGDEAMIPPRYFRNRVLLSSCLMSFLQFGALLLVTSYLPLWFQVCKGRSPLESGVDTLPTMLAQFVSAATGGKILASMGYITPLALLGSVCSAIGSGLMTTFTLGTPASKWIGYQILAGYGRGIVILVPIIAIQAVLDAKDVAIGSALVVFSQYFGAALFVALGQTLFLSRLKTNLVELIPGFNVDLVLNSGAGVPSPDIPVSFWAPIFVAYDESLTQLFYLATAGAVLAFFVSFGIGRTSVKKGVTEKQSLEPKKAASEEKGLPPAILLESDSLRSAK